MSQHLDALQRANTMRLAIARVKGEVSALGYLDGARRVAELLRYPDDAAGAMTIDALVMAIRHMGSRRVDKVFFEARFPIATRFRRVRELTQRQRDVVADILDDLADATELVASRRSA